MPDSRSLTDLATLIDHGCLVRLITFHLFINQEKRRFLTQVGHLSRPFLDRTDMNILVVEGRQVRINSSTSLLLR